MKRKEKKSNKYSKEYLTKKEANKEEYGYDFVAELAHFTNIDEQDIMAKRLEDISDK